MGSNSFKNSRIKIPKPHTHLHIIGGKTTKFQVYPMKDVDGVAGTKLWLEKCKSAWVITRSEIVKSKFQNHIDNFISYKQNLQNFK